MFYFSYQVHSLVQVSSLGEGKMLWLGPESIGPKL